MENITIRNIKEEKGKNFANRQTAIINRRFNFIPFRKIFSFGAYRKNKLVGYAKVYIMGEVAELNLIIIRDNLTSKGMGSKLINHIEVWAKKKKCKKIVLKTTPRFKEAVKFYKRHGYKIDAVLNNYYHGCNWYYMSKRL